MGGYDEGVPPASRRMYVGVTIATDPDGNRELASVTLSSPATGPREVAAVHCERQAPAICDGQRVQRWSVMLGRSGARRTLFYERGRFFMWDKAPSGYEGGVYPYAV